MHEAKVVAVSDAECIIRLVKGKQKAHIFSDKERDEWEAESAAMAAQYISGHGVPGSGGIDIGDIKVRLKMLPLQGMKTNTKDGSTQKVFGTEEAEIPIQMILFQNPAPDPRFKPRGPMTIHDRFPVDSRVVITKGKYRGCVGTVHGILDDNDVGVSVTVIPPEPPFGLAIVKSIQESYITANDIAGILRLNPTTVAKVTASLYFNPGKFDLGLNFAYKGRFYILGYSRRRYLGNAKGRKASEKGGAWKTGDSVLVVGSKQHSSIESEDKEMIGNYVWEFSPKAVKLIAAYMQLFPALFAAVQNAPNDRAYDTKALGPSGSQSLGKIREWLDTVETAKLPRIPCTTSAMPPTAVKAVQHAADVRHSQLDKSEPLKVVHMKVPSSALYREGSTAVVDVIQSSDNNCLHPELGMRVVNLCAHGVPFGARGTVVAVHDAVSGCVEVVMDEEFIGGSTLQGSCSPFRGKLCVWSYLLTVQSSDSKDLVDKMVPSLSLRGHDEVSTVTASVKHHSHSADQILPKKERARSFEATSPKRTDGVLSQQLGKHGAWREAVGPDKSSIGFHDIRCSSNGLESWRKRLLSIHKTKEMSLDATQHLSKSKNTADLKVLLGMHAELKPNHTLELKALLGVGTETVSKPSEMSRDDNMLGSTPEEQAKSSVDSAKNLLSVNTGSKSIMLKTLLGVGTRDSSTFRNPDVADNKKVEESDVYSWEKTSLELNNIENSCDTYGKTLVKGSDVLLRMVNAIQSPTSTFLLPQQYPYHYASANPRFNFIYVPEGNEAKESDLSVTAPIIPSNASPDNHPVSMNNYVTTNQGSEQEQSSRKSIDLASSEEQEIPHAGNKNVSTTVVLKNVLVPTSTIRAPTNKNKKVTKKY